jgi:hypothetical protein
VALHAPATATYAPRAFVLGNYFLVTYLDGGFLKYKGILIANPTGSTVTGTFGSGSLGNDCCYDAQTDYSNSNLYIALIRSGSVTAYKLTSGLSQTTAATGISGSAIKVCAVIAPTFNNNTVWFLATQPVTAVNTLTYASMDTSLTIVVSATVVSVSHNSFVEPVALSGWSDQSGNLMLYQQVRRYYTQNGVSGTPVYANWSGSTATPTDAILGASIDTLGNFTVRNTTINTATNGVIQLGVGLFSKAFVTGSQAYFVVSFGYSNTTNIQPSYFLIADYAYSLINPNVFNGPTVVGKLAYGNGGGYAYNNGDPTINSILVNVSISGSSVYFPYLIAFSGQFVPGANGGLVPSYEQLGINQALISIHNPSGTIEAAGSLHTAGILFSQYDQLDLAEHGFCVYPDDLVAKDGGGGGAIGAGTYQYKAIYQWTDNQGNLHRSAPTSVTTQVTIAGNHYINLYIPTLRLTQKQNVVISVYRSSGNQPTFWKLPIASPTYVNDPTINNIYYVDNFTDAQIATTEILYTNGGIVENIQAPPCLYPAIYKDRVFVLDSEDRNLLWYSKQVIEATPVEFSDLFTIFVAPNYAGDTGIFGLKTLDDKLIIFKQNGISYITGSGPDNTGANNDFSDPITITASVGCTNNNSIVYFPGGILFQASLGAGIWLLDRGLGTSYIGSPVSKYNSANVVSALLIPGTNQIRFTMDNGIIILYDYFVNQWSTFTNTPGTFGVSACLWGGLHTYLAGGQVNQESVGTYTDLGAYPITMNFTTAWISMAGIQGYQRSYFFYLLGQYLSAHNLTVSIAYDYNSTATQTTTINPNGANLAPTANGGVEQWRVFLKQQRCESFQITIQENYTGTVGAGLTLTGLNILAAIKSGWKTIGSINSVGRA